jgi:hypothetical protein
MPGGYERVLLATDSDTHERDTLKALSTPAALAFRDGGSVRAWHGPGGVDATWTRPTRSLA